MRRLRAASLVLVITTATIVTAELEDAVQTPFVLEVKVTAPPPFPPDVVGAKGLTPNVVVEGPVIVSAAWLALLTVSVAVAVVVKV